MMNHFVQNQQKVWAFIKAAHTWEKRMFKLNFSKKLMNCPTFPDEVLRPFIPSSVDTKNATPAKSHEPFEEETNSEIPYTPPHTSKKGKEKQLMWVGSFKGNSWHVLSSKKDVCFFPP